MLRTICALFALTAAAWALPVLAAEQTEILVSGTGTISLPPDLATVEAEVQTNAVNADEAVGNNNAVYNRIVASLERIGIRPSDIALTYYNVRYNPKPETADQTGQRWGYFVNRGFTVKVHNMSKVGAAVDACSSGGSSSINGVSFGLANDAALRSQAMARAVADAREKAQILAQASGLRIVGIKTVNEGGYFAPMARENVGMVPPAPAPALPPTQLSQSNVSVTANVNVTFLASP